MPTDRASLSAMEKEKCICSYERRSDAARRHWTRLAAKEAASPGSGSDPLTRRGRTGIYTEERRRKVVYLLRSAQTHMGWTSKTLHKAVHMLDRICTAPAASIGRDVPLLALACLNVAAKYAETAAPSRRRGSLQEQLLSATGLPFTAAQFQSMETKVLNGALHGVTTAPDAVSMLRTLLTLCAEEACAADALVEAAASSSVNSARPQANVVKVSYTGEVDSAGRTPLSYLESSSFRPTSPREGCPHAAADGTMSYAELFEVVKGKFGITSDVVASNLQMFRLHRGLAGFATAEWVASAADGAAANGAKLIDFAEGVEFLCTPDVTRNFLTFNTAQRRGVPYLPNRTLFCRAEAALDAAVATPFYMTANPSSAALHCALYSMLAGARAGGVAASELGALFCRLDTVVTPPAEAAAAAAASAAAEPQPTAASSGRMLRLLRSRLPDFLRVALQCDVDGEAVESMLAEVEAAREAASEETVGFFSLSVSAGGVGGGGGGEADSDYFTDAASTAETPCSMRSARSFMLCLPPSSLRSLPSSQASSTTSLHSLCLPPPSAAAGGGSSGSGACSAVPVLAKAPTSRRRGRLQPEGASSRALSVLTRGASTITNVVLRKRQAAVMAGQQAAAAANPAAAAGGSGSDVLPSVAVGEEGAVVQ
eukprot:Rhum_TRINITY_DN14095_c5_g1::Rhum_TRINITY_DN14095_c5_g1_i1::g.68877::m.68877